MRAEVYAAAIAGAALSAILMLLYQRGAAWTIFRRWTAGLTVASCSLLAGLVAFLYSAEPDYTTWKPDALGNYGLVALFGGTVGAVEILSRYRDDPWTAVRSPMALVYMAVNASASLAAYCLIVIYHVGVDAQDTVLSRSQVTTQVLMASFGSMAFFRSALFNVRFDGKELAVGPGLVFQVLLSVTDRSVDRSRAIPRARDIPKIMRGVDFRKAAGTLTAFCIGSMQNLSEVEQVEIREQVDLIASRPSRTVNDQDKANLLGLLLVNIFGKQVLEQAVNSLGSSILSSPAANAPAALTAPPTGTPAPPAAGPGSI